MVNKRIPIKDNRGRKLGVKYHNMVEWFKKNREGFGVDIAKAINCDRTQLTTYCNILENNNLLEKESRPYHRGRGTHAKYYIYVDSVEVKRRKPFENPDLPATLSLLSFAEMHANGAFNPSGYQSEGRHKRAAYGPDIEEKKKIDAAKERQKILRKLHDQVKPKKVAELKTKVA